MEKKSGRFVGEAKRKVIMLDIGESIKMQSSLNTSAAKSKSVGRPRKAPGSPKAKLQAELGNEVVPIGSQLRSQKTIQHRGQVQLKKQNDGSSASPAYLNTESEFRDRIPVGREHASANEVQNSAGGLDPRTRLKKGVSEGIDSACRSNSYKSSIENFQAEVISSKLWEVQSDSQFSSIPQFFDSLDSYIRVFEPLLFEECRAQIRSQWEEISESDAFYDDASVDVKVDRVEFKERGWIDVFLFPLLHKRKSIRGLPWKDNDVAVLASSRPRQHMRKGSMKDFRRSLSAVDNSGKDGEATPARTAGFARKVEGRDGRSSQIIFRFCVPQEVVEEQSTSTTNGGHVIRMLKALKESVWFFTAVTSVTTAQREFQALHSLKTMNPSMLEVILRPSPKLFSKIDSQSPPELSSNFTPSFIAHLNKKFNPAQLSAIKWSVAHTASDGQMPSKSNKNAHLTANSMAEQPKASETKRLSLNFDLNEIPNDVDSAVCKEIVGEAESKFLSPFTLVQGPPGTGKTHTVCGMLNVIHLVQYQRYLESLVNHFAPSSSTSSKIEDFLLSINGSMSRCLPSLTSKPRILVCAPSNAAVNELLTRVVEKGFVDGELRVYWPDVARVGMDSGSAAAQAVSVEQRTQNLLNMSVNEASFKLNELKSKQNSFVAQLQSLNQELMKIQAMSKKEPAAIREKDTLLQHVASVAEDLDKVLVDTDRLQVAQSYASHEINSGSAVSELEISFASEADIVFTTLASSGRRIFSSLKKRFDMVVIDEAAQSSEVAVLAPLKLTNNRCVMIGDPQQLPATVISRQAQNMQYSRSLFQRFQDSNCPSILLNIQFRMHPSIREFPSNFFYGGRLVDAPAITEKDPEPWFSNPLLQPYLFFDVERGRESQGSAYSYENHDEADMAVLLFNLLQKTAKSYGASGPVPVGIVTPYKQQLKCLRAKFEPLLRDLPPGTVYLNTVDAFQGQERDVVIMSCVRASSNKGVGFVSDVRRLNVAITRAKRGLWILGNANSLSKSQAWDSLIKDAKSRKCYVPFASVGNLFPEARKERVSRKVDQPPGFEGFKRTAPAEPLGSMNGDSAGRKDHPHHGRAMAGGGVFKRGGKRRHVDYDKFPEQAILVKDVNPIYRNGKGAELGWAMVSEEAAGEETAMEVEVEEGEFQAPSLGSDDDGSSEWEPPVSPTPPHER